MKYFETDGAFYKDLAKIALPVALQSVITTGVNLVDTIMLGQLGETALSASSLANHFISLFLFLCMGISMGASVLTSRFWGARDFVSLKKVITVAMRFGILLALLFTVVNIAVPEQIMSLYSQETEVILEGAIYLRWSTITFLLTGLSTVATNIMRSVGLTHIPFIASISAFLINIGGNYIFIFGKFGAPRMGVAGAALGTVIARVVETAVICGYFWAVDRRVRYRVKDLLSPCRDMVGEFLRVSVPVMLSDGLLGVGDNVLAVIMGHIGSSFVSANAITVVVQRISTIFITGLSYSGCFIIGKTLGEGGHQGDRRTADGCHQYHHHLPFHQLHLDKRCASWGRRHPVPLPGGHHHHVVRCHPSGGFGRVGAAPARLLGVHVPVFRPDHQGCVVCVPAPQREMGEKNPRRGGAF